MGRKFTNSVSLAWTFSGRGVSSAPSHKSSASCRVLKQGCYFSHISHAVATLLKDLETMSFLYSGHFAWSCESHQSQLLSDFNTIWYTTTLQISILQRINQFQGCLKARLPEHGVMYLSSKTIS
jgi:hypothetical protein